MLDFKLPPSPLGVSKSRLQMCAMALYLCASAVLPGCANSPIDRDWRAKVRDVVPIAVSVGGAPPSVRADIGRVDFRAPSPSPR